MTAYFAHTSKVAPWQPLRDHLRQVAVFAKQFAENAWPANEPFAKAAYCAGLLHDLGKYRRHRKGSRIEALFKSER
ncbi:MAG: HD domain-containing protein [Planctomycetota bacterium]